MSDQTTPGPDSVPPGQYRHFKGGRYYVDGVARVEADPDQMVVVYRALSDGTLWTRPIESFTGTVEVDGATVRRFERIGD